MLDLSIFNIDIKLQLQSKHIKLEQTSEGFQR